MSWSFFCPRLAVWAELGHGWVAVPNHFPREIGICFVFTASVSVASNIAEGRGRLNPAEFRQFLGLAQGSTYELQTQLLVVSTLGMSNADALSEANSLTTEVSKMLGSLIRTLNSQSNLKSPKLRENR